MSAIQTKFSNRPPATPATSIWIVIDNLPGEDDEDRQKLEELRRDLKTTVVEKARASVGSSKIAARAGIAKTGKLRVLEDPT